MDTVGDVASGGCNVLSPHQLFFLQHVLPRGEKADEAAEDNEGPFGLDKAWRGWLTSGVDKLGGWDG